MENACQFLYRHSLLPELGLPATAGPRVNLTFRSKTATTPLYAAAPAALSALRATRELATSSYSACQQVGSTVWGGRGGNWSGGRRRGTRVRVLQLDDPVSVLLAWQPLSQRAHEERPREGVVGEAAVEAAEEVFVGQMPGVDHRPRGFKDTMFHPFESPFVDDPPRVAAARYRRWLLAQPAFLRWVVRRLAGRTLLCGPGEFDVAHAQGLTAIVETPLAPPAAGSEVLM